MSFGVVTNGIAADPFAGGTILGIQDAAREAGFVCMMIETSGDPNEGEDAVASVLDRGVDGVIYASPYTGPIHASDTGMTPTAFVNCWPSQPMAEPAQCIVVPDEYGGGLSIARAVFAAGHRSVAFLGGTPDQWATRRRFRGFKDAAREVGIDPNELFTLWGDYSMESGYLTAKEALHRTQPTALICGNDRMALGAILAAYETGTRPPTELSITGYDDQTHLAAEVHPGLTTVALPFYEMGYRATRLLTRNAKKIRKPILEHCRLITRASLQSPPR